MENETTGSKAYGGHRAVRHVLLLFITLFIFLFKFQLDGNEVDVLPYARAFYNPNWLSADWYLHLNIPYRFAFSYPFGFAAQTFGWLPTIMVGRILSYLLFAAALYKIKEALLPRKSALAFLPALLIFLAFFHHGFGAKEWIIGALDTKVFAYIFALAALAYALQNRWTYSLALAGLALSFHLLVGVYSVFCLATVLLWALANKSIQYRSVLTGIVLFIFCGSLGLYGIVHQLSQAPIPNSNDLWKLYVEFRVPHHLIPAQFPGSWSALLGLFLVIHGYIFRYSGQSEIRSLSLYALASLLLTFVGLATFHFGPTHLLRFYFFRYADGVLPLLTLLTVTAYLIEKQPKLDFLLTSKRKTMVVLFFSVLLFLRAGIELRPLVHRDYQFFNRPLEQDVDMMKWIKENTTADYVFVTIHNRPFWYFDYERPLFVSFKHAPQSAPDLAEWERRLRFLKNGESLVRDGRFMEAFFSLSATDFLSLKKEHPEVGYLLLPVEMTLDLPLLHRSEEQVLYDLRE